MADSDPPQPQEKQVNSGSWTSDMREVVTHMIAVSIVGVTLLLLAVVLWKPGEDEVENAKGISAILGPWVGVVIGFYFGVRSGEKQAQAVSSQVSSERVKREATGALAAAIAPAVADLEADKDMFEKLRQNAGELRTEIAKVRDALTKDQS